MQIYKTPLIYQYLFLSDIFLSNLLFSLYDMHKLPILNIPKLYFTYK